MKAALVLLALAGCKPTKEREDMRAAWDKANGGCITHTAKRGEVQFCVADRTLSICSDNGGCLYVQLDQQAEEQKQ